MSWNIRSHHREPEYLLNEESLFFTGNGYIGVRGNFEEGYSEGAQTIRGTYINAFHDIVEVSYGEKLFGFPETQQKLLNVIDTQTIRIALVEQGEEEWFSLFSGEVISYERILHLDQGYTERIIHWRSSSGKEVKIHFKRLASFTERELFIQEVTVTPINFYGCVKILSTVNGDVSNYVDPYDPRTASGHAKRLHLTEMRIDEPFVALEVETERSRLKAAAAVSHSLSADHQSAFLKKENEIEAVYECRLTQPIRFTKKSIFTDTLRHGNSPLNEAMRRLRSLHHLSFQEILLQQIAYLRDFWQHADVLIEGDHKLQEGIRFNLYHLLQSIGRDPYSNISAKGLSGEGYEGHYFWDTEIYIFPVFLMTHPSLAKNLLLFRYFTLDFAREHAKVMGHRKGALFPWRTISGTECSAYFPSGSAQYHISADIAYSYIQYYLVTKDTDFMEKYGAEILFETARLWIDTGHYQGDHFVINAVTGPDEYTCIVNNNYYTNVMAKHNLEWAVKIYEVLERLAPYALERLKEKLDLQEYEIEEWKRAARQIYLPYDEKLNINPQDDSFLQKEIWDFENTPKEHYPLLLHYHPLTLYRYQVCKQADTVLAHFLLEDEQEFSVIRDSFDYYEKITTHDSSLSSCIFSIMAARVGYRQKAYDYFIETARLDLDNTHGNTKDGLHMANMGGTWMAIVFGFAGLRIKESGISMQPIIPKEWQTYRFKLQYQGRTIQVTVTHEEVQLALLSGESLTINIYQKAYRLEPEQPIEIKQNA